MILYYTGSEKYNIPQNQPTLSIGGFVSNSIVPNSSVNNLFPSISANSLSTNPLTRGIILKNDTNAIMTALYLFFVYQVNQQCKYEIAAVTVSTDANGGKYIERLENGSSIPYYGTFVEANGETNKVLLGNIPIGGYLGLWIKRTILTSNIITQYNTSIIDETTLPTQQDVEIHFKW
jgi:hypothetical protein